MVKHTQTIRRLLSTNCLRVFDYFVGLAFKGLRNLKNIFSQNYDFQKSDCLHADANIKSFST